MTDALSDSSFIAAGRRTLAIEAAALGALEARLDQSFAQACQLLLECRARVVVTGIGKSGHIGHKIAATLASTGTPAFFVHPSEAGHGDLGMITSGDVVLAISYSGRAPEILTFLPLLRRLKVPMVCLTGDLHSPLASAASAAVDVSVAKEACPLDLAPTASTTCALALGDALAVALLEARGFTREDFARSHPSGTLGRRLLLQVGDVMQTEPRVPKVKPEVCLLDALKEITAKGLGMTTVVDAEERLVGLFTDGDLRRALDRGLDIRQSPISAAMTPNPQTVTPETLAAEALTVMENRRITALVAVDHARRPVGVLHMHHLLQAGIA